MTERKKENYQKGALKNASDARLYFIAQFKAVS